MESELTPMPTRPQVRLSQLGPVSGILSLFVNELPANAHVDCSIDGQIAFSEDTTDRELQLNIHTHLLEAGPHQLTLVVSSSSLTQALEFSEKILIESFEKQNSLYETVRQALVESDVPVIVEGPCDSALYSHHDPSLAPWFDQANALDSIEERLNRGEITPEEAQCFRHFVAQGYTELPFQLEDELIADANRALDEAIEKKYQGYEYGTSQRLEQMHNQWPAIRKILLHQKTREFLNKLFQKQSDPCQSLVFIFGSQQDAHQDTIHLTPLPTGYMCGVWTPLEDVRDGSGELVIYPGSHRLPRLYMKDADCPKVRDGNWNTFHEKVVLTWKKMIEVSGLKPQVYRPKKGTLLVWHENLMHAGSPRTDLSLSRRSVVTHHFARGGICYFDSTGMPGYTLNSELREQALTPLWSRLPD